jgi:flavodoxin
VKKILVVYHTRTGFTGGVAKEIASACGADLESVVEVRRRFLNKNYVRFAIGAALHASTPIARIRHAPDQYDLVVVGTPIWCWNMSGPIRAFLNNHRNQCKQLAFFCTYGGSGAEKVLQDMTTLAGKTPTATVAITNDEITKQRHQEKLKKFMDTLLNPRK